MKTGDVECARVMVSAGVRLFGPPASIEAVMRINDVEKEIKMFKPKKSVSVLFVGLLGWAWVSFDARAEGEAVNPVPVSTHASNSLNDHASPNAELEQRISHTFSDVRVSCYVGPCQLSGDFDSDGQGDMVVPVESRQTKKRGLAILLGNGRSLLVGLGKVLPGGSADSAEYSDFKWVGKWEISPKSRFHQEEGAPANGAVGDYISLSGEYLDSGAAMSLLIYWDGQRFMQAASGD